jgi:hypothetical protein
MPDLIRHPVFLIYPGFRLEFILSGKERCFDKLSIT